MSEFLGGTHAVAVLLFAGVFANGIWRLIGLAVGGGIHENSEILVWVRAVAAAILAGVIAQIIIAPPGALASVPFTLRIGSVAAGFAVYLATRKSVFAGVVAGEIVLLSGKWWMG